MSTVEQQRATSRQATLERAPDSYRGSRSITSQCVHEAIETLRQWVAPLWPLFDAVAVNPWVGLTDRTLLEARAQLRRVRECELLPELTDLQQQIIAAGLTHAQLTVAYERVQQEHREAFQTFSLHEFLQAIQASPPVVPTGARIDRAFRSYAEIADARLGSEWQRLIVDDLSRYCAAHFDRGQAIWSSPFRQWSLYDSWRAQIQIDQTMAWSGLQSLSSLATTLNEDPCIAIEQLLAEVPLSAEDVTEYLATLIFSINGWASYLRRESETVASDSQDDFLGLLAMRLAYDIAVARQYSLDESPRVSSADLPNRLTEDHSLLTRYVLLTALEHHERKHVIEAMCQYQTPPVSNVTNVLRPAAQLVFRIDVRSEVLRRHLEAQSSEVQTFGFAGFFGLSIAHRSLGAIDTVAQCPVLLQPSLVVEDRVQASLPDPQRVQRQWWTNRALRKLGKQFQSGVNSCFSYVESLGLAALGQLVNRSLSSLMNRPRAAQVETTLVQPTLLESGPNGVSIDQRINQAEAILRNLGLTENFARLVVFCGHGSHVTNNPLKATLDCGACGGHSGEVNARVAADLLQDARVRDGLAQRGISIPIDTRFVAGLHVTTTDEVRLLVDVESEREHGHDLMRLREWLRLAGEATRFERAARFGMRSGDESWQRSADWSEVRPEWVLAGNRWFIVGPREATQSLNLGGQSFLHSYEEDRDPEGKVLELILTAPMVVASWINLQYFGSSIDQRAYGSGDKTTHNVVGLIGLLQGNGGDLMTGLAFQSVHDGSRLQHTPRRLSVIVYAMRQRIETVVQSHWTVKHLAENGWQSLIAIEDRQAYRWSREMGWTEAL